MWEKLLALTTMACISSAHAMEAEQSIDCPKGSSITYQALSSLATGQSVRFGDYNMSFVPWVAGEQTNKETVFTLGDLKRLIFKMQHKQYKRLDFMFLNTPGSPQTMQRDEQKLCRYFLKGTDRSIANSQRRVLILKMITDEEENSSKTLMMHGATDPDTGKRRMLPEHLPKIYDYMNQLDKQERGAGK